MADDELANDLERMLRVALTAGGQLVERYARARADADRARQTGVTEARVAADRELARQVEAGRAVYSTVRDADAWSRPDAQRNLGEALVAAQALREVDPVARVADQYIRAEARRRHGDEAEAWLAAGVASFLEEEREASDRRASAADVVAERAQDEAATLGTVLDAEGSAMTDPPAASREDGDRQSSGHESAAVAVASEHMRAQQAAAPGYPRSPEVDHQSRTQRRRGATPIVARSHGRDFQGRA